MRYPVLDPSFYESNRTRLQQILPKNSLSIVAANKHVLRASEQFFPFKQNPNLFYLTGIEQDEVILVLRIDRNGDADWHLFIKNRNPEVERWDGRYLSIEDASKVSGMNQVFYMNDLQAFLESCKQEAPEVFINVGQNDTTLDVSRELKLVSKGLINSSEELKDLLPYLVPLRLVKSSQEIALIKDAGEITKQAFLEVLSRLKKYGYEYEIEAEITHYFLKKRTYGHAFRPIIASGRNALILHYNQNAGSLNQGELLLMDFGADYLNYAADFSRTIPVNGKYSHEQKFLYEMVYELYKQGLELMVPGTTINEINRLFAQKVQDAFLAYGIISKRDVDQQSDESPAFKKYFMHGLTHFLGLDVHDVGTRDTIIQPGMVLTCEPGFYSEELGIGIRIENDILVADKPIELVPDFPVDPTLIEQIINQ